MSLGEYQRKRDFKKTPEPSAQKVVKKGGNTFVVQKHDASHLHYDFRLELDGALKSWAVPKGPSYDPKTKRLAVQVEDHPLDYGSFEGVIPAGQYGGGTVVLWDRGTWETRDGDPMRAYAQGRMKFTLQGEKLQGDWALVRMKAREGDKKDNWLLIKEKDEFADTTRDIIAEQPDSVATGRSLSQIAKGEKSPRKAETKKRAAKSNPRHASSVKIEPSLLPGAVKAKQPSFLPLQLCTLVKSPPRGETWLHEVKYDGYRIEAIIQNGEVQLFTRNEQRWTAKFPEIAGALAKLPHQCVLDGEIVVLRPDGTSDFQALQNMLRDKKSKDLRYLLFDLIHLDGYDLGATPLHERKKLLDRVLKESPHQALMYSAHIEGEGDSVFANACRLHLEGIISKRTDSPYVQKRGRYWVKSKCLKRQEFVIGGYTDPGGSRKEFGALLIGYYANKKLVYAGKVGTGFEYATLKAVGRELKKRERSSSPFDIPPSGSGAAAIHWVEPALVCEVEFTEWTTDGHLRHPAFKGLREDKPPKSITRERAQDVASAASGPDAKSKPSRAGKAGTMEVAGVKITNPDRLLYPEGITKADLAEYYHRVSGHILPYIANRPLSLVRCPQGRTKQCFFQKHPGEGMPPQVRTVRIKESKEEDDYLFIDSEAGLVALANLGVLEFHVWGCRQDKIEKPDTMVFDLDPDPGVAVGALAAGALALKNRLSELGLISFLKITGGKGLHVVVPLLRRNTWDQVKEFSRGIATELALAEPTHYVATMSKAKRKNRIFIDYLRNGRGATFIAPFSTRARLNAPVSVPLAWEELNDAINPAAWTLHTIHERLASGANPWKEYSEIRQSLTLKMIRQLDESTRPARARRKT